MSVAIDFGSESSSAVEPACPAPVRPGRHLRAVPAAVPTAVPQPRRGAVRPARHVPSARPADASVAVLRAPLDVDSVPLRLTRRGVVVLALLVAALGAALVWVAAASASEAAAPSSGSDAAVVTVRPGDTLWSIASRVAPDTDPRAEVDTLRRLNHLDGVSLVPGQQLHLR